MSTPLTRDQEAAINQSGEEARRRRGKFANPPTYKEVSEGDSSAGSSQDKISTVSKSSEEAQKKRGVLSKPVIQNPPGNAPNADEIANR